jgi:hypothetical protein
MDSLMNFKSWLKSLRRLIGAEILEGNRVERRKRQNRRVRLQLEALEDRLVPASPVVNTSMALTASVNGSAPMTSIVYGKTVTLIATVTPASGSTAPSLGTVEFLEGSTELGAISPAPVVGNHALFEWTIPYLDLPVLTTNGGVRTFSAVYSPSAGFSGSSATLAGGLTITPEPLILTATVNAKTYDGTATAAAVPNYTGLLGSDSVTGLAEAYDNSNASPTSFVTLTGINEPDGLAFDSSGNLYIANTNAVSIFAPGATTPYRTLAVPGPLALAFDGNGNLYVASGNNTVSKFAPEATTPSATLTGLSQPQNLAFDGNGNLFVLNFAKNTVSKFAPGATTPSATLTGLDGGEYMVVDGSGDLFVANSLNSTVSEFAPGATSPSAILTGLSLTNQAPIGMVVDSSGNPRPAHIKPALA